MAQIIKHRRGGVTQLKDVTARVGELVMATGSISDLNGPFLFIGETEGVQGAYRAASKIYQGSTAPTLTLGSHGSVLDGTPFYASGNESLYILSQAGNTRLDLSGNIEDRVISRVTINTISGNTNLVGDLLITGSTYQTGSIDLTGNVTLGGNITIGNQTTDLVVFQGEVSSSILPELNNTFDLGAPSQAWRNLHVSGTAYIENINIGAISTTNLYLPGDLIVSGTTTLSGSVLVEDLTEKRLVVVGVDGQLVDYSGLTFDNGNLNLSGALEVTNIQGTGSLYLKPDLNDSRDFRIYNTAPSDIHIKGNASYSFFGDDTNFLKIDDGAGTLTLDSTNGVLIDIDTTVSQSLSVDGHINLTGTRQIRVVDDTANTIYGFYDGSSILGSYYQMFGNNYANASQRGGAEFVFDSTNSGTGGFNISEYNGSTWLRKLLVSTSGVEVTGTTTLNGSLTVTGTTEMKDAVGINSTLDVTGSATFKNNVVISGTTTISGDTFVQYLTDNRVLIAGANGKIEDDGNLTFDGTTLKVGDGQFEVDVNDGDIRTSGSLTVQNGMTINGNQTINGDLTVTGNTMLYTNLYVSGNVEFLSGATYVHISSSVIELDDNIIRLNAYSPFERYAGFEVIDSGSSNTSASLVWDSLNDYWMFVSSSGTSSKLIGTTAGAYGSEVSLTVDTFPIATGANTIGDSLLTMINTGTTLAFNTNKFTIASSNGATMIAGNVTLTAGGGADAGTNSSAIVFRNSSNVLGYISTTVSTVETNGLLGYRQSNGSLIFSDLIDGGTY